MPWEHARLVFTFFTGSAAGIGEEALSHRANDSLTVSQKSPKIMGGDPFIILTVTTTT